ncbi:MAG: hypothetical protein H6719_26450 [Sandaracinaceae bacterium]|nr:hypothetical protein [Sandaracinaceae bacterium]
MSRRAWLGVGAAVVAIVAAWLVWDALVITDEERLEVFAEEVTGAVGPARVNGAIARWIDLDRQPFEVSAFGESLYYGPGEDAALAERAAAAVRELRGVNLRRMQTGITVEGDEARVSIRLLSRERGMGRAEWRLRRHGDDWLAEHLTVAR